MFVLVRCVELKKGKPSLSCLAADDVQLEPTSSAVTTLRREEVTNTGLVKENVYKAGSNAVCEHVPLVVSAKNVDELPLRFFFSSLCGYFACGYFIILFVPLHPYKKVS